MRDARADLSQSVITRYFEVRQTVESAAQAFDPAAIQKSPELWTRNPACSEIARAKHSVLAQQVRNRD
jgi:hypothetical protein